MFDRRLVQYFNWGLLGLFCLLAVTGSLTLYSALTAGSANPQIALFYKQMIWYTAGLFIMALAFVLDYKFLERWAYACYFFCVSLLVFVMFFGRVGGGSKRWLVFGPVSIQPSEFMKIAVIIVLAKYFAKVVTMEGMSFKELFLPMILVMIPCVLVLKQPDLGTAIMIFLIAASMTLFIKIEKRTLACLVAASGVSLPLLWFFVLKQYQKQRILTFLDPDRDPLNTGYHIIQSKIAIGSGMIFGKGVFKGTQNALSFLPEQHTDFIFSVFAEEWGFIGSALLVTVFAMLILWGLNIAYECRDTFGIILAVGVTGMIFWQVIINMGMVMGLMPVVGVPLPFISYGGSSVISMMVCMGILMNISMRRFMLD
ncbi:rod shape-determining protein RodA [Desulfobacterales bacterium HSG16]|nr:rod shape-determining protein RodA [Desulfobacterales bacterium HSG16]